MLFRCFDKTVKTVKFPSYRDCTVHPDWLLFSNFRRWMLLQDWEGKVLDKDILVRGNKEYGPLTCMMVTPAINSITTFSDAARGQWPLGVSKTKINGVYYFIATLSYYGKQKRLGYFKNPEDASACYLKAKNAHIQKLADEEPDEKVASALRKWVIT